MLLVPTRTYRAAVTALLMGVAVGLGPDGGRAVAQEGTLVAARADAATEVAAALYAAAATQEAAERVADQRLREQRAEIERLRVEVTSVAGANAAPQAD